MSVEKTKCPVCEGEGRYKLRFGKDLQWVKCQRCEGTGRTSETVERKEPAPLAPATCYAPVARWSVPIAPSQKLLGIGARMPNSNGMTENEVMHEVTMRDGTKRDVMATDPLDAIRKARQ